MSDHSGDLGELSEEETLARLTTEEKRRLARSAILEFPHLDHGMLDEWLRGHSADSAVVGGSLREKTDALLDHCETLVRSGEDPEAFDRFVYGQVSPVSLEAAGIDPAEMAARKPLEVWDGVYDGA
ncbi:hypothetical protein [Haloarchaeobius salinus]|uniref:hypothetical protein n=1 Tax=Haloarchaeobius salinus TaxID=1198298 RepID=UPI00210B17BC|nr:hypothetical protein [Haloarchaeobius salinus]